MKKTKYLLILPFILFILLSGIFVWWSGNTQSVSTDTSTTRFVITKGMGATQIAYKLKEAGLVKNPLAFKFYVQLTNKAGKIQAGEYSLKKNLNLYQMVAELLKGPSLVWVTIPEGLRKEQIAIRVADSLGKKDEEYNAFVKDFVVKANGMEGYLYPDTYLLPKDITPQKTIDVMKKLFDSQTKGIDNSTSYSFEEMLITASLIERESRNDSERPVIAGIIYKRLENDWPLQIDAAIQYQKANISLKKEKMEDIKYWGGLTKDDLETASVYNTYKNLGLPPTPICNPGISSIKAAANPQDTEYWFYLHDVKGQIHYAKTLEEHNQNVRKYLR